MNPKTQKRIEALLATFDSGAVQPEELNQVVESLLDIIKQSQDSLTSALSSTNDALSSKIHDTVGELKATEGKITDLVKNTDITSRKDLQGIVNSLSQELKRIESQIPIIPDQVDLTDINNTLLGHTDTLDAISRLIVAENLRNALEALPTEDEKLKIEAIGYLRKELDDLKVLALQKGGGGAIIARYLYQIGDVNLAGLTDGQTIVWDNATQTWIPTDAGTGSGTVDSVVAGSGISVDSTDPANPVVSTTGGSAVWGGITGTLSDQTDLQTVLDTIPTVDDTAYDATSWNGNTDAPTKNAVRDKIETIIAASGMDAATYDPNNIASDAFDQDNMTDGTTNKNYTATEQTKLAGIEALADVTDATNVGTVNAGASSKATPVNADSFPIVDSEASNVIKRLTFTNLKAFLKTYLDTLYAGVLGADDNYVTDAEKTAIGTISGKEDVSNKATDFTTIDNTLYPTVQAVNNAINTAVTGLLDYRGTYDVSGNAYPSSGGSGLLGAILKGDFWICSVSGTLNSKVVTPGDLIIALVDTPSTTDANWDTVSNEIGYTPENVVNKSTSVTTDSASDTKYPSVKSVYTWANGLFATITNLALKAPIASPTFTGTVTIPTGASITTPVLTGLPTGTGVASAATASTLAARDANKNLTANAFIGGTTSVTTAAGITTMSISSTPTQVFTGSSTQTVKLPTTSVPINYDVWIINTSSGAVTVQSSGANTILVLPAASSALFSSLQATPTTAAHWTQSFLGLNAATGATGTGKMVYDTSPTLTTPTIQQVNSTSNNPIKLNAGSYTPIQTYTPSAAGTATLDLSLGNTHFITMPAGNITIALSNATVGQYFSIRILQDGTGSRTVTWFSTIRWAGGSAPTLTTTASKADLIGVLCTGSGTYDAVVMGANI